LKKTSKLKNCLELKKTGQLTHLPGQTSYQGENPMLPNGNNLVHIEEEVNFSLRLLKTNYTPTNQKREKRQQKLKKN